MSTDLVYDTQVKQPPEASKIADDFLALFGDNSLFFTNVSEEFSAGAAEYGFHSLTGATFNVVLAALGNDLGVALWVDDED